MTPRRISWPLLALHAALVQLVSFVLRPAASARVLDAGEDPAWLGVMTALFAIPPLLLAIPVGRFVDVRGERTGLVLGALGLAAAATAALAGGGALWSLLVATGFLGLGVMCSVLGQQAWVARRAQEGRPDAWFGRYTFATSLGQLVAPAVLAIPARPGGGSLAYGAIDAVLLVVAVLLVPIAAGVRGAPRAEERAASAGGRGSLLRDARDVLAVPGAPAALASSGLVLASVDVVVAYTPLLVQSAGLGSGWIAGLLAARAAAGLVSRLLLARLTALAGRRRVMVLGAALAALALVVAVLPVPGWVVAVAMAVYGFTASTVQPLTMSWMVLIAPPQHRGLVASLRMLGNRSAQSLLPLGIAALSSLGGAVAVFAATAGALACSAVAARRAPDD